MTTVTTTDGVALHAEIEGPSQKPALLLIHALGADHTMWDPQVAPLAKHFRIIRYDMRGHGRSAVQPGTTSVAQLGADALAVLDAAEASVAFLCGMSIGGVTGLWLAANAPDRFRAMVLASSLDRSGTPAMWDERIASVRAHGMADLADATTARWFTAPFRELEPEAVDRVRQVIASTPVEGYVACCTALRAFDLTDLASVPMPLLFLPGESDTGVPVDRVGALAARLGAEFQPIPGAHLHNVESPDAFNAAVVEFLLREGGDG